MADPNKGYLARRLGSSDDLQTPSLSFRSGMARITHFLFALTAGLAALKRVRADDVITVFQPPTPTGYPFLPFPRPNSANEPKIIGVAPIAVGKNGVT
ncbi:hypothetical protein BDN70DRAFT_881436 [Pholiota conissans]|uniref:Uncharacterized protein n=1 Tax=Pholiota conissans TaxID=109636 RepID=A0A9P6CSE7_9AGAR|nr:hypothetical protein BDN70DRAFT_881436 [Pholiota conissans]